MSDVTDSAINGGALQGLTALQSISASPPAVLFHGYANLRKAERPSDRAPHASRVGSLCLRECELGAGRRHQGTMNRARMNVAIPRLPVLGWATFRGARQPSVPSLLDSPRLVYTTSGRAAIGLALRILDIGPGDRVLVPTYHCPTMIAPVVRLGAAPMYFPVTETGAPDIEYLSRQDLAGVRAMLAAHYFGFPQPLSRVRAFCDTHGIALIEDCAHAFFGTSEGRPVGGWGDLAIASLTKFFPVPEGGCLIGNTRSLDGVKLGPRGAAAELKALFDAVELGVRHHRFPGFNAALRVAFGMKEVLRGRTWTLAEREDEEGLAPPSADEFGDALLHSRLTRSSRIIVERAHRSRIIELRRRNYRLLGELLAGLRGARPFGADLPEGAVPYVFPLKVEHPNERYRTLRAAEVPLYRWDRIWPGTPTLEGDSGVAWSTQMFQLGCHQDLSEDEIRAIAMTVQRIFASVA